MQEELTKAGQTASLLVSDLRQALSLAIDQNNGFAEIVLLELIEDALRLATKIHDAERAAKV
jgi:hypothetical protein